MATGNLRALTLFQQETPAFPFLESAVDLCPEGSKIIDRRPDGKQDDEVEGNTANAMEERMLDSKNQQRDCRDLRHHFDLALTGRVYRKQIGRASCRERV